MLRLPQAVQGYRSRKRLEAHRDQHHLPPLPEPDDTRLHPRSRAGMARRCLGNSRVWDLVGAMRKKIVDEKSYELAEYFLQDSPEELKERTMSLAQDIQQAVEDWFERESS
jgi:hypothetical protein